MRKKNINIFVRFSRPVVFLLTFCWFFFGGLPVGNFLSQAQVAQAAVAYDAVSESHTGTTGSASEASFSWTHTPAGTPKGVLVYTFVNINANDATGVTYGGVSMTAVTGGRAVDTATEDGDSKVWFLGSSIPTGAQTVVVNRTNNADEMYAVAITVTATVDTTTNGVVLQQENQAPAEASVNDGSPGSNSVRFAGANYGDAAIPIAGASSTALVGIDFGQRAIGVVRETTAGQGARSVGFADASDDWAAVHLAVREISYSPTVALNTPADASSDSDTTPTLNFTGTDGNADTLEYNVQVDTGNAFIGNHVLADSFSTGSVSYASTQYAGMGQSFTGIAGVLDSCKFSLSRTGSPTGYAVAKIYNYTGTPGTNAIPTGAALATSDNLNVLTGIGTSQGDITLQGDITFTFSGGNKISLSGGIIYIITVEYSGVDASNYISFYINSGGDDGNRSMYNGSTWTSETAYDLRFAVYVGVPLVSALSATDAGFTAGHPFSGNGSTPVDYTLQSSLTAGLTYYWRVAAIEPNGQGTWSATQSFTVTASTPSRVIRLTGKVKFIGKVKIY